MVKLTMTFDEKNDSIFFEGEQSKDHTLGELKTAAVIKGIAMKLLNENTDLKRSLSSHIEEVYESIIHESIIEEAQEKEEES